MTTPQSWPPPDGTWYQASDLQWYCWPNPTPYASRPAPVSWAPPVAPMPMPAPVAPAFTYATKPKRLPKVVALVTSLLVLTGGGVAVAAWQADVREERRQEKAAAELAARIQAEKVAAEQEAARLQKIADDKLAAELAAQQKYDAYMKVADAQIKELFGALDRLFAGKGVPPFAATAASIGRARDVLRKTSPPSTLVVPGSKLVASISTVVSDLNQLERILKYGSRASFLSAADKTEKDLDVLLGQVTAFYDAADRALPDTVTDSPPGSFTA